VDIDFTLPFTRCTVARRLRYSHVWLRLILVVVSTVATPGEWQCKIRTGSVRRLTVANGPNIFQMLLVIKLLTDCLLTDNLFTGRQLSPPDTDRWTLPGMLYITADI